MVLPTAAERSRLDEALGDLIEYCTTLFAGMRLDLTIETGLSRHMSYGPPQNQARPCTGSGTLLSVPNTCSRSLRIYSMADRFSIQTNFAQLLVWF